MKTLSNFEKITKKNKRKNWIKWTLSSILITLVILTIIVKILTGITAKNAEKNREYFDVLHSIAYPNTQYNSAIFEATSLFSGYYHMNRTKDIDGIEVPYEDIQAPYSLYVQRNYLLQNTRMNTANGGRAGYTYGSVFKVPMFYNRNYDYGNNEDLHMEKTQDILLLQEMPNDAVEIAITFDKAYTLKEIDEKIPDNLKINWYWIGTSYEGYDTALLSPEDQIGFTMNPYLVRDGKNPEEKEQEAVWRESYTHFTDNLQLALDKEWLNRSSSTSKGEIFNLKKDIQQYIHQNHGSETATFAGVILTGRSENFEQLENADWIFASNIGQNVEIQPYHQFEKE